MCSLCKLWLVGAKYCGVDNCSDTKRMVLAETFIQILVGEMYPTWNVKLPEPTFVEGNILPATSTSVI
jgi:hypothetical protein